MYVRSRLLSRRFRHCGQQSTCVAQSVLDGSSASVVGGILRTHHSIPNDRPAKKQSATNLFNRYFLSRSIRHRSVDSRSSWFDQIVTRNRFASTLLFLRIRTYCHILTERPRWGVWYKYHHLRTGRICIPMSDVPLSPCASPFPSPTMLPSELEEEPYSPPAFSLTSVDHNRLPVEVVKNIVLIMKRCWPNALIALVRGTYQRRRRDKDAPWSFDASVWGLCARDVQFSSIVISDTARRNSNEQLDSHNPAQSRMFAAFQSAMMYPESWGHVQNLNIL